MRDKKILWRWLKPGHRTDSKQFIRDKASIPTTTFHIEYIYDCSFPLEIYIHEMIIFHHRVHVLSVIKPRELWSIPRKVINLSWITRKQTLRSLLLSYQKKDGRASSVGMTPTFWEYNLWCQILKSRCHTDSKVGVIPKDLKICFFLMTHIRL